MEKEAVLRKMVSNIKNGIWVRGERIPSETELADLFSISRNTVRSIIQRLSAIGMLVVKHGEGTFVSDNVFDYMVDSFIPFISLDKTELIDLLEFHKEIEVEFVKLAALKRDEEDLRKMKECVEQIEANRYSILEYARAYMDFHICLASATKNKIYYKTYIRLKDLLSENLKRSIGVLPFLPFDYDIHRKIYMAIVDKNYRTARKYLKSSMKSYLMLVKENMDEAKL